MGPRPFQRKTTKYRDSCLVGSVERDPVGAVRRHRGCVESAASQRACALARPRLDALRRVLVGRVAVPELAVLTLSLSPRVLGVVDLTTEDGDRRSAQPPRDALADDVVANVCKLGG